MLRLGVCVRCRWDGALRLRAPNGDEELVARSSYEITLHIDGITENVFVEYLDNNGIDWIEIDTMPNVGSYQWKVPNVNLNQCLVWNSDAG